MLKYGGGRYSNTYLFDITILEAPCLCSKFKNSPLKAA